ncbi:STAS domain-containing protein [Flammeovirgaceae bacterium SG7u.111]|nr:STAS domain-containing protein [Flammeovirgaceae bacterium SG7u.132]WPO35773.1 STAS domain-containing protein [Flammeovirgaceae bacterium SG7u.111]
MELEITDEGHFHIISIHGDLDATSSIQLDDAIETAMEEGKSLFLFDCKNLNYISSPGIGVFTSRIDDYDSGKLKMVLFGMSEKVYNVFKLLGLHKLLPITNTKEEAKTTINGLHNKN